MHMYPENIVHGIWYMSREYCSLVQLNPIVLSDVIENNAVSVFRSILLGFLQILERGFP